MFTLNNHMQTFTLLYKVALCVSLYGDIMAFGRPKVRYTKEAYATREDYRVY